MSRPRGGTGWLSAVVSVAGVSCLVFDAFGQSYPVKPIRIFVGTSAGGGSDTTARTIAQKLTETFGQSVIVENRTGAAGSIAIERVITSPADGYTLLLLASSAAMLSSLRSNLPYDLERDLAPVSLATVSPNVLVIHPSVPARNVKELIALARAQDGKLNYGTSGVGGSSHLMGELLNLMAKVKIVHVPYKGGAESSIATAAGQIDMSFASITSAMPFVHAGKLKALAITSAKRTSLQPSIPTIDESGVPGYDRTSWYGVCASAGAPKDVIARLNAAIVKTLGISDLKDSFHRQGLEARASTPEQFATFIQGEIAQNIKLVKLIGLKPE